MKIIGEPVFRDAIIDFNNAGITVSADSLPGSQPYAIVGGRSNARWWLVPLGNGQVTASSFALFQPLLASARIMKLVVCMLSLMGLSWLWAKNKIYLSGASKLDAYFPCLAEPAYAYFTGTDSPHRKVAVQVMDSKGHIKGFAKLGSIPQVVSLLQNETAMLEKLRALQLKAVRIPQVLYSGPMGEGYCLLTNTLKTPMTSSVTKFGRAHRDFLCELADATALPPTTAAKVAAGFERRIAHQEMQFDPIWRKRLQKAVETLAEDGQLVIPQCMNHGDFTPWNTFIADGRLYVFDWEYAEDSGFLGNDIIHFVINQPQLRNKSALRKTTAVKLALIETLAGSAMQSPRLMILTYLLKQTLFQVERLLRRERELCIWDGAEELAAMFDFLFLETEV